VGAPRRKMAAGGTTRREILVFAEGAVTEEIYLVFWKRRFRRQVNLEIHELHGTPLSLVQKAAEVKTRERTAERRRKGRAHDEVWCVFDVDEHPYLREAVELAAANDINVAISNPCIELWFLLHFVDQTAYIERHDAQRGAGRVMGCKKTLTDRALDLLAENFDAAKGRARALDAKHSGDGTPAPGNPSSGVWRLIDAIKRPLESAKEDPQSQRLFGVGR
jgi:hypothetical protein